MKRFAASILALGLAAAVGTVSAQSGYSSGGDYYSQQPSVDRYGNASGAQYDYARVVRVDPVIESGYSSGYQGNEYQGNNYQRNGYQGNGYAGNGSQASRYYGNGYQVNGYPGSQQQRCYSRQDGYYAGSGYDQNNGSYRNDGGNDGYRDDGYYSRNENAYSRNGSNGGSNIATVIGGVIGAALGSQVGGGSARYATAAVGSMVGGIAGRQIYESNNRYRQPRTGMVTVCDPVSVNNGYYPANGRYSSNDARVAAYDVTYEYAGRRYTTRTNYHPGNTIRVRVDVRAE